MQCVILAGGLGTRMRPWTERLPKTLIPVHGVPFAHYQLAWLARHGVTEVVYSIAVLGEMVRDFVGDGSRWGLAASYVEDGKELVGTGGALRRVFDSGQLRDRFLVLYGDSFLPFDFRNLWRAFLAQPRPAMMSVYRNRHRFDTGNVRFADGVVQLYRKAKSGERPDCDLDFIDYGLSALSAPIVAEWIPYGTKCDLADVYHRLSVADHLAGFEVQERFYEIGSPSGLRDFETWVEQQDDLAACGLASSNRGDIR
jgi:NDP-sugar pyrophosphorylase family protein